MQIAALEARYGEVAELEEKLKRFLPGKYCGESGPGGAAAKPVNKKLIAEELGELVKSHSGKSREKLEREYLSYVKDWQVYGSTFWHVQPQGNLELPSHVILAIHPKGVLLINPESFEVIKSHKYSDIPQWGSSKSSFVLYIGNLIKQTKTFFSTPTDTQGDEMNVSLFARYTLSLSPRVCWRSDTLTRYSNQHKNTHTTTHGTPAALPV